MTLNTATYVKNGNIPCPAAQHIQDLCVLIKYRQPLLSKAHSFHSCTDKNTSSWLKSTVAEQLLHLNQTYGTWRWQSKQQLLFVEEFLQSQWNKMRSVREYTSKQVLRDLRTTWSLPWSFVFYAGLGSKCNRAASRTGRNLWFCFLVAAVWILYLNIIVCCLLVAGTQNQALYRGCLFSVFICSRSWKTLQHLLEKNQRDLWGPSGTSLWGP